MKKYVPQSWLDKPYLKYEGKLHGVPVYSPKQEDLSDVEYLKLLKDMENKVYFINEDLFVSTEDWLTTKQASEILGVTDRHVRRLIDEEKISAIRVGKEWRINPNLN